jgi:hypothetical protein
MLKLFKELMFLVLALGAIMFLVEKKYSTYKTPIDIVMQKIDSNNAISNIYYLGNSHAGAMGQKYLDRKAINLSNAGMSPFQMKEIATYLLQKSKVRNTIIINMDYDFVGKFSEGDVSNLQFYKYTGNLPDNSFATKVMANLNYYRSGQDYKYLWQNNQKVTEQNFVPINSNNIISEVDCQKKAFELAVATFNKKEVERNKEIITSLLRMLQKSNHRIIVVTTPKKKCFMKYYLEYENVKQSKPIMDSLLKMSNLEYMDFTNEDKFVDSNFVDYDHFNESGAIKFQEIVNLRDSIK